MLYRIARHGRSCDTVGPVNWGHNSQAIVEYRDNGTVLSATGLGVLNPKPYLGDIHFSCVIVYGTLGDIHVFSTNTHQC
jgi:hypothetical protein